MKENKEKKEKKPRLDGEKKFYLFTAIGCAAVLIAIIVIAIAVSNASKVEDPEALRNPSSSVQTPSDNSASGGNSSDDKPTGNNPSEDEPVVVVPDGMLSPIESVNVSNDFGFYHNTTLNNYYEHTGIDFTAAAGSEVKAAQAGTIESIYKADLLLGTQITIDHGDGLKTVYRFVEEKEGLAVGDKVERGEVIATVAEANGNEYKDGAHLHFEVMENGVAVDPTKHLTLEEK